MNNVIKELYTKFENIKKLGWIKSIKKGPSGIGLTFENLIGINENEFEIPDFNGIEIKTKREYSSAYTTLFNATPDGPHFHETKRLKDKYGYPHSKYKEYRVLNVSCFANEPNKIGINYYFQLNVDRQNEKLFLLIYNRKGELIENEVFWYFDSLKEKLYRKLKILAFIKAYTKKDNELEFFKYHELTIYLLKDFNTFLSLIEKGIIRVTFKVNAITSGTKKGTIRDHGTSFGIKECDLDRLYDIYDSNLIEQN